MSNNVTEKLYTFAEISEKLGVPERRIHVFAKRNIVEVTDGDKIYEVALIDLEDRRKRATEYVASVLANAHEVEDLDEIAFHDLQKL